MRIAEYVAIAGGLLAVCGLLLALLAATGDWVSVGILAGIVVFVGLGQLAARKGWLE